MCIFNTMAEKEHNGLIIIAHRGASSYEPENTMRSFKKALELGCDAIEFDIRMSMDRQLVVMHDSKVNRTTDGTGHVRDKTVEELKDLDAGDGEKIPTVEELFKEFSGKANFVLELKEYNTEEQVLDMIYRYGMLENSYIVSFSKRILKKIKILEPGITTGLIKFYPNNIFRDCEYCGVDKVAIFRSFINKKITEKIRDKNLKLFAWVVNKKDVALKLQKMGIRGIVTDRPDILK